MKYIRTFEQQSTDHLKDVIDWKLLRYLQEYLTPLTDKGVSVLIEIEVNNITTYIYSQNVGRNMDGGWAIIPSESNKYKVVFILQVYKGISEEEMIRVNRLMKIVPSKFKAEVIFNNTGEYNRRIKFEQK